MSENQVTTEVNASTEAPVASPQEAPVNEPVTQAEVSLTETIAPNPKQEEAKPLDKFASRFAELSRKDKALQEKRKAIEAQEAEIAKYKEQISNFESLKSKAKENPLELLQHAGLSIEDITNAILKNGVPEQVDPIKQEIEANKAEIEKIRAELEAAKQEKLNMERQKAYSDYKSILDSDMKEFPLTSSYHDADFIIETVNQHFQKTGEILPHKEILSAYEQYYEDKLEAIKSLDKVKNKFGVLEQPKQPEIPIPQQVKEPVIEEKPASKPAAKPAQTLSNKTATPAPIKSVETMSEEERKAYAASILRGMKK